MKLRFVLRVAFLLSMGLTFSWSATAPAMEVDVIEGSHIQIALEGEQAKQLFEVLLEHVDQNSEHYSENSEGSRITTGAIRCTHYRSAEAIDRERAAYRCHIATDRAERYFFPRPVWFGAGN